MRVTELIGVIVKERVDEACKDAWMQHNEVLLRSDAMRRELQDARMQLDQRNGTLRHESKQANTFIAERDATRAELAGVAAQRDAHLSRSVELAARVTELEARLAAVAPATVAPVEVDGFRAGDLVYAPGNDGRYARITDMSAGTGRSWISTMTCSVQTSALRRKPVEVGDAVRCVSGPFTGRAGMVTDVIGATAYVEWGTYRYSVQTELRNLVAVAP